MSYTPIANNLLLGLNGGRVVDSTSAFTGEWGLLEVITQTVINSITITSLENASGLESITLPAGTIIRGNITSVELTSGVVILYNK